MAVIEPGSGGPAATLRPGLVFVALPWHKVVIFCALAVAGFFAAIWLRPDPSSAVPLLSVAETVPRSFGNWREVRSPYVPVALTPEGDRADAVAATYDESVTTTYADRSANQIMVALAYGRSQRQEGKIHRPELCYSSQGFSVSDTVAQPLDVPGVAPGNIVVNRMVAESRGRKEVVSYWIRIGNLFSTNAVQTRLYILKEGLEGRIPDGILFRVSQIVPRDAPEADVLKAFNAQEQMMVQMAAAVPAASRWLLLGGR